MQPDDGQAQCSRQYGHRIDENALTSPPSPWRGSAPIDHSRNHAFTQFPPAPLFPPRSGIQKVRVRSACPAHAGCSSVWLLASKNCPKSPKNVHFRHFFACFGPFLPVFSRFCLFLPVLSPFSLFVVSCRQTPPPPWRGSAPWPCGKGFGKTRGSAHRFHRSPCALL